MYRFTPSICDGLTLNAPYPSCQANARELSRIRRLEFAFRIRNGIGQCQIRRKCQQQMDVIFRSTDGQRTHEVILCDACEVVP